MDIYIYKSNGTYLGFTQDDSIYSRDGIYLGWVENNYVWDNNGQFRGQILEMNKNKYIARNIYTISPIPKIPKAPSGLSSIPTPPSNIEPVNLPIGFQDGF